MNARHLRIGFGALVLAGFAAVHGTASAQLQLAPLYSFSGADGAGPMAGLAEGPGGLLFGTTSQGGAANLGTAFRFDPTTRTVLTLHEFSGADGATPYSGLAFGADGLLYGTTFAGGAADLGTVFRVAPSGAGFAVRYAFSGADGARPEFQTLVAANGALLGAASESGPAGGGTLFRFDPASASLATLVPFGPAPGVDPGLLVARDGSIYGTTYSGGASGGGSIFRVDPVTGSAVTLHDFSGADGLYPLPGTLSEGGDGSLYGTTQTGGGGYGSVYRLDPATGAFTTLHAFSGVNDGRSPFGGVTEGADGYLYGTTALGGAGYGIVYRVHPVTKAYGIVAWFGGTNGRMPYGNLLRASDGALYGTTRAGGAYNGGTVFRLAPADTTAPVIASVTATPNVLSPANGKMTPVAISVTAADAVDPSPKSRIVSVICNEPASGDWQITGDLTVSLRARRLGKSTRIYTITIQCTDASGNSSQGTVTVTVPK